MTDEAPKQSLNALVKVREAFVKAETPLTLYDIKSVTNLTPSAVSMALCHLLRQRYVTRELIKNPSLKARRIVWSYQYHPKRLPKEES